MKTVAPGGVVGILGGGQLGRMLSLAAARMGLDVVIYAPEGDSCAARVSAEAIIAAYEDKEALKAFAKKCDVITFEFENIPHDTLALLEKEGAPVFPKANALASSQDRLVEKQFLESIGVAPAPFKAIDKAEDIKPALESLGGKGILKTRRDGYDGKGQIRLSLESDFQTAWTDINGVPAVLEKFVPFEREISVVTVRSQSGEVAFYDPPENDHSGGILRQSKVPAQISDETHNQALAYAGKLAEALDYVGVLALELFVLEDGTLLANEFAPRVHNSGHWTEDVCLVGQFEQHMRAVCGWPLGPTERLCDVKMDNLLGDSEIATWNALCEAGAAPRIYGKRGGGEGRKLGHSSKVVR